MSAPLLAQAATEAAPGLVSAGALLYGFAGAVITTLAGVVAKQHLEMRSKDETILRLSLASQAARLKTAEAIDEITAVLRERLP